VWGESAQLMKGLFFKLGLWQTSVCQGIHVFGAYTWGLLGLEAVDSGFSLQLEDYKINPKKRVATQLLNIEKEILKNALVALDILIDQLPDSSISSCSGAYAPHLK
jgi:hypothetical protein